MIRRYPDRAAVDELDAHQFCVALEPRRRHRYRPSSRLHLDWNASLGQFADRRRMAV